ncbi:MAG: dephospho-CoA kinase [Oscillospiraceae bacterium]|nr:dephospho-CoA kinase [Oscillospiraceae bacterium]
MKNIVLGLTGQTGAGKSTLCQYLQQKGCTVIDADQVARNVVEKGSACIADIVLEFGVEYLTMDGNLNRRKLAESVFTDKTKLKKLNDIMFPYIINMIREQIEQAKEAKEGTILLDAPTLFESGCDKFCDRVVSVIASQDVRCHRIIERDGLSEDEAMHRITSQHSDAFYVERSWIVVQNNGDVADLQQQADALISRLEQIMECGEETVAEAAVETL